MLDEEPCFMFIVLCTDFYTYCDLFSISCTINQIDLWIVTVKSIVLFLSYFLEL